MKKIILICIALVLGVANTAFSIPVKDFNAASDTGILNLNNSISPLNFTFNEASPASFEAFSGTDVAGYTSWTPTSWTPNWLNRPEWSKFYYDIFIYCKSPKYGTGSNPNPVPEPATILLLGSGLVGLACFSRKRMKS